MEPQISGIHHITAIASDPQENIDFYSGVLGLRLVKVTINYDDPGSYHFYYGDGAGNPGSILTFFAWPGGYRGRRGSGQATVASFAAPPGSLGYWQERFAAHQVSHESVVQRWDEEALVFYDRDGLKLELVTQPGAEAQVAWAGGSIPTEYATRGFHSLTLTLRSAERTAALLTETMGFHPIQEDGERMRLAVGAKGAARTIDLLTLPEMPGGKVGVGTVHHVAWRTPDDAQQQLWLEQLTHQGYGVSPVMDRQYFHSIYFREPGEVLFEIATDPPGFTVDEPIEHLGARLCLPVWLEPHRDKIQAMLPPVTLPQLREEVRP